MSLCINRQCPHGRGAFVWLGDGPWLGDPADPDYNRYPRVHDTSEAGSPGHLRVCDLMPFATAAEAGEICVCGHESREHRRGLLPAAGGSTRLGLCSCGCPDFRHRPEDVAKWARENPGHGKPQAPRPPKAKKPDVELRRPRRVQFALFDGPAGADREVFGPPPDWEREVERWRRRHAAAAAPPIETGEPPGQVELFPAGAS